MLADLGGRLTTLGLESAGSTIPVATVGPLAHGTVLDEPALHGLMPAMSPAEAKELLIRGSR